MVPNHMDVMTEILHYTDVPFVLLLGEVEGVEVGVSGSAGVEEEDNCLSANRPRGVPWRLGIREPGRA